MGRDMNYTFSYMIANAALVVVWLGLYMWRRDVRGEMQVMSMLFGVGGLFVEPIYLHDWWRPLTVTGTPVGVEDFIFGAVIGGISAVAYEVIFRMKIRPRHPANKERYHEEYLLFAPVFLCSTIFLGLFFAGCTSFWASVPALLIPAVWILFHRPDLITNALVSGALMVFFGFWWFWAAEWLTPGWVAHYWLHQHLSGVIILTAPIEDLTWGFLAGLFIGPLYEFWHETKLYKL